MSLKTAVANPDRQALEDCRARIDRIDNTLHDLLRDRADIVDQVRKLKGKQTLYIRPGREAQMVRALVERPVGKIPDGLIVRLWREMISAFTLMEGGGLRVAVPVAVKGVDLWDIARDFYGAFTPLIEHSSPEAAIKAVLDDKAELAVVPFPQPGDKELWWPLLAADRKNALTVFAAAPFELLKPGRGNARPALAGVSAAKTAAAKTAATKLAPTLPQALVVGRLYPELTGDDHSFLCLTCVHVPEGEIKRLIGKAGYKLRMLLTHNSGRAGSAPVFYLAEIEGFVGRADTRLSRLRAMLGSRLQHLAPLGGYAVPLKAGRR